MSRHSACFAMLGLFALSGCVLPGSEHLGQDRIIPPPPREEAGDVNPRSTDVEPPPPPRPAAVRPLPPKPLSRPAFPRVRESQLAGLSAEHALSLFGKPNDAERDGRMVVWSYRHEGCSLTLMFQFSVADNGLRTVEYDLATGPTPTAICLHVLGTAATRIATRPRALRPRVAQPRASGPHASGE